MNNYLEIGDKEFESYLLMGIKDLEISSAVNLKEIEFQQRRWEENNYKSKNISSIFCEDDKPVFIYLGLEYEKDAKKHLGMFDYGNYCYIDRKWVSKSKGKKYTKRFFLDQISIYKSINHQLDNLTNSITRYDEYLLKSDIDKKNISMNRIIHLCDYDLNNIRSQLRKSFKPLINKELKRNNIMIFNSKNITKKIIYDFRKLHIEEAGRETRSEKTWLIQYEAIKEKQAFLVCNYKSEKLLSAGYFSHNDIHCCYGVSANSSNQGSKILFHSLLWKALEYSKQINLKYFELGQVGLLNESNIKDKKFQSIADFKSGFGGETHLTLSIKLKT